MSAFDNRRPGRPSPLALEALEERTLLSGFSKGPIGPDLFAPPEPGTIVPAIRVEVFSTLLSSEASPVLERAPTFEDIGHGGADQVRVLVRETGAAPDVSLVGPSGESVTFHLFAAEAGAVDSLLARSSVSTAIVLTKRARAERIVDQLFAAATDPHSPEANRLINDFLLDRHPVPEIQGWDKAQARAEALNRPSAEGFLPKADWGLTATGPWKGVFGIDGSKPIASSVVRPSLLAVEAEPAPSLPESQAAASAVARQDEVTARPAPAAEAPSSMGDLAVKVAALVSVDLDSLARDVDHFFARLADLGEGQSDSSLAVEVALWSAAVTAGAYELARLRLRRQRGPLVLDDAWVSGLTTLGPGEPE